MHDLSGGLEPQQVLAHKEPSLFGFTYSTINKPASAALFLLAEDQYSGCDCVDNKCTDVADCICLQRSMGVTYDNLGHLTACTPHPGHAASNGGDSSFQKPVLECNVACACAGAATACANRVVQLGLRQPLEVFATRDKGYGVHCPVPIDRGAFVCEYVGEVMTQLEAKRRVERASSEHCGADAANYLLALKEHLGSRVLATYVDATNYSNVGRFLNHSCTPNLEVVAVRVDSAVPRVAFFAKTDIAEYEELTFSYGGTAADERDLSRGGRTTSRRPCLCGTSGCLGYLPYDADLFA